MTGLLKFRFAKYSLKYKSYTWINWIKDHKKLPFIFVLISEILEVNFFIYYVDFHLRFSRAFLLENPD